MPLCREGGMAPRPAPVNDGLLVGIPGRVIITAAVNERRSALKTTLDTDADTTGERYLKRGAAQGPPSCGRHERTRRAKDRRHGTRGPMTTTNRRSSRRRNQHAQLTIDYTVHHPINTLHGRCVVRIVHHTTIPPHAPYSVPYATAAASSARNNLLTTPFSPPNGIRRECMQRVPAGSLPSSRRFNPTSSPTPPPRDRHRADPVGNQDACRRVALESDSESALGWGRQGGWAKTRLHSPALRGAKEKEDEDDEEEQEQELNGARGRNKLEARHRSFR
ncbi:hypothetical protein CPLU01_05645 [Colletotrichum plurivorum]|uniref:Uncharacterized protein n=1 Tax=Colletotrichum plurivorum TaxID=2175906 RepID=A0A8H6KKN3_9PEZI|nr:hypothetical protein CPLU01_05645 [Colletotrichum plurivorum]